MGSLKRCIGKVGLNEHEAGIIKAKVNAYRRRGFSAQESSIKAVGDYVAELEAERADVVAQLGPAAAQETQPPAPETSTPAAEAIAEATPPVPDAQEKPTAQPPAAEAQQAELFAPMVEAAKAMTEAAKALTETVKSTQEASNAKQDTKTGAPDEDVRQQQGPEERQGEMPAAEGRRGVREGGQGEEAVAAEPGDVIGSSPVDQAAHEAATSTKNELPQPTEAQPKPSKKEPFTFAIKPQGDGFIIESDNGGGFVATRETGGRPLFAGGAKARVFKTAKEAELYAKSKKMALVAEKPDDKTETAAEKIDVGEKAVEAARAIGEANPSSDVAELRSQVLKDHEGADIDDVTEAVHEGQYQGIRKIGEAIPVKVLESDISKDLANRAFSGTSHTPEKRAKVAIRDYVRTMVGAWQDAEANAKTPEDRLRLTEKFRVFKDGYVSRLNAYLSAHGRVMSAFIVGPAKFPTSSNAKKSNSADNRLEELTEWKRKGIKRLMDAAKGPIDKTPAGELDVARRKLQERQKLQDAMKAANKVVRDKALSNDQKVEKIVGLGLSEKLAREALKPDFMDRTGFPDYALKNNNAEIRRLTQRVSELEGKQQKAEEVGGSQEVAFDGGTVELDYANGVLRIRHSAKPPVEVRDQLKREGFHWSPTNTAWQRKITDNAIAAAERITGAELKTKETDKGTALFSRAGDQTNTPEFKKWFGDSKVVDESGEPLMVYTGQPRQLDEGAIPATERNELPFGHAFFTNSREVAARYAGSHPDERGNKTDYSLGRNGRTYRVFLKIENPWNLDGWSEEDWRRELTDDDWKKLTRGMVWDDYREIMVHEFDGTTADDLERLSKIVYRERVSGQGYTLEYALAKAPDGRMALLFPKTAKRIAESRGYDGFIFEDEEIGGTTYVPFNPEQVKSATGNRGTFDPNDPNILLSRAGSKADHGISISDLETTVSLVTQGHKNLPQVIALERTEQAPDGLRQQIEEQGATDVEGAFYDGKVYLFAGNLRSEVRAEHVLMEHELGHYGLRGVYGKELDPILNHIYLSNPKVARQAAELRKAHNLGSNAEAVEEVLVEMPSEELPRLRGWDRLVSFLRDWFASHGFNRLAERLNAGLVRKHGEQGAADLFAAEIVTKAREWARSGEQTEETKLYMGVTKLSDIAPAFYSQLARAIESAKQAKAQAKEKKWGARVGTTEITATPDDRTKDDEQVRVHSVDITTAMRDSIMQGQALFSRPREHPSSQTEASDEVAASEEKDRLPQGKLRRAANVGLSTVKPIVAAAAAANRVLDKAVAMPFRLARTEKWLPQSVDWLLDQGARLVPEKVKAGTVSDYGLTEKHTDKRIEITVGERKLLRRTVTILDKIAHLNRAESSVVYHWMQEKPNTEREQALLNKLPAESRQYLDGLKGLVHGLSKEALRLGLISQESYDRNNMAYLHRTYAAHEFQEPGIQKQRSRAIKVMSDAWKGRGLREDVSVERLEQAEKGKKYVRIDLRGDDRKRKRSVYIPEGKPIPAQYASWERDGVWEVRWVSGGDKVGMWRDLTAEERQRLGELDEIRFAVLKTVHEMARDIEVAKFLEWVADNESRDTEEGIDPEHLKDASESLASAYKKDDWVLVPETTIPRSGGTKVYGKLAGKYVPGPVWNDIRQVAKSSYKPWGETYAFLMKAFKVSKTALSPVVHTNNVFANFMMSDWHDVESTDMHEAASVLVNRGSDEKAKALWERFEDSGATIGMFAHHEIKREQLAPLLEQLRKEIQGIEETDAKLRVAGILSDVIHGKAADAVAAIKQGKAYALGEKAINFQIDLYQREDEFFRLATFLKGIREGKTDLQAGKDARKSFLDYDINAPWIQAARHTVFPFISFPYRAVPMAIDIAKNKPWKLAKLMLVASLLNSFGYMMSGGDEDDERAFLPDEKAGKIWGIVPKLIRMPWNDENEEPVFLDVRRWVPLGDFFDVGETNSALPLSPVMIPGGPLAVLAELISNRSNFTGKDITKDTDFWYEKVGDVSSHLYMSMAPNAIWIPGSYSSSKLWRASVGTDGEAATDAFGREYSVPQAMVSSFGIKVASYPKDNLMRNALFEYNADRAEIERVINQSASQLQRNLIDRKEYDETLERQMSKLKRLNERFTLKNGKRNRD